MVVCFTDVSAERGAAERLRRSERLLAETQRLAHVGSWEWEAPGPADRLSWTDEMYRLAGLVPQSVMVTPRLWLDVTHPSDRQRVAAALTQAFTRPGPFELAQRMVLTTGEVRHLAVRGEVEHDAEGPAGPGLGLRAGRHRAAPGAGGAAPDRADRPADRAGQPAAAGRPAAQVDRRAGRGDDGQPGHVAVIAVDLDGLKRVNDTYGHATGDDLLRETARRLRSVVRDRDLVARLGGDEFVLLCAGVDVAGAARLAERIVAEISSPYLLAGGVTAWSGASVGVTVTDDPRADVDRLLAQADRALYAAKGDGGNRYVVHPRAAGLIPPGPNLSLAAGGA